MKFKYIILILVFIFTYGQAKAEPRCESFYKKLYNDTSFPTDPDSTDIRESSIGFNLRSEYDEEKDSFVLKKNINGYYIVGKITQVDLVDKIQTGDVILSINNSFAHSIECPRLYPYGLNIWYGSSLLYSQSGVQSVLKCSHINPPVCFVRSMQILLAKIYALSKYF